uniref:Leucine rich immune protein (Coil-less) n=1 Tax=Anopheles epiroticus TaxID=199890 RepID=A0A240PM33_9DIPT
MCRSALWYVFKTSGNAYILNRNAFFLIFRVFIFWGTVCDPYRTVALRMQCYHECYIYDFQSADDTYAFHYIPNDTSAVFMENVLLKVMNHSILDQLPTAVNVLRIEYSVALKWISVPQNLYAVEIIGTSLERIDFKANSAVKMLQIQVCDLVKVPPAMENAENLIVLEILRCKLLDLDMASFCENPFLRYINLKDNRIRYVVNTSKKHCGMYNTLTHFLLQGNRLTTVNMEQWNVFVKLDTLSLVQNRITSISGQLVQHKLQTLSLHMNRLKHISTCGWYVPSLKKVDFSRNQLTVLPECINNLTSVRKLSLGYNRLANFSIESVAGMSNMTELGLACNGLTAILLNSVLFPPKLAKLDVTKNYLTSLDLTFVPVKALEVHAFSNLISSFDVNGTSPNVSHAYMLANPFCCSWEMPFEWEHVECSCSHTITNRKASPHCP